MEAKGKWLRGWDNSADEAPLSSCFGGWSCCVSSTRVSIQGVCGRSGALKGQGILLEAGWETLSEDSL